MAPKNVFQSRIFLFAYRFVIPAIMTGLLFLSAQTTAATRSTFQSYWVVVLFLSVLMFAAYSSVTLLDQVPSKKIFWKGLWRRLGVFQGDTFLPLFDRSDMHYFYFFNALAGSILVSLILRAALLFTSPFPNIVCSTIALINFFLLFIPYAYQYQTFDRAVYCSESQPKNK